MFLDLLTYSIYSARMQKDFEEGVRAFVRLYYDNNTDATCIETGALKALQELMTYVSADLELVDVISETEAEINVEGGVRSATNGKSHKVSTYPERED